jgi:catechol 2,3-dioxygenase-like lactoylglutathione lyase family enzyme
MGAAVRILELRLAAYNLERQRAFYADLLGLKLIDESPAHITVQAGTTQLRFDLTAHKDGAYHVAFNIPDNQLQEAKRWLLARTDLLMQDGLDQFASESWNAEQLYFRDADGNILEFIARHELPTTTATPFNSALILNLSEVGYVVPDVAATVEALHSDLNSSKLCLTPYRNAGPTFAPLGDAHGLLIVAALGRPWFPTDEAAVVLPLQVTLESPVAFAYTEAGLPYRIRGVTS